MAKDPEQMERESVSENTAGVEAAVRNVTEAVRSEDHDRYPDRTHVIAADLPEHGGMATEALFAGDPVAIVYPDGREVLLTPGHTRGFAAVFLSLAIFWLKLRSTRSEADVIQMPPRTHIEARGPNGVPLAA